ncbi:phage capsid protein [Veronia nyctiphanis]|uniref:Phage capsid protein n=1 Tax=Veronia nyctiphanis TaxID=1278244 RepID=A0A4V1LS67_9GAMM|nr:GPO family capsid scaffolding protein [Veronia nyctiphanis]RXJ70638.1 phage capsid protein [Veronia nyctiphanis]
MPVNTVTDEPEDMSKLISKFVRVCREGATTDGRKITRQQIDEMASNYNPDIYGARIWLEHFRSLLPDGVFPAFGDVTALKADDDQEGKRILLAKLSPTSELLELNKRKQKVFTSIEMDPSFSDTKQAYMVGLAVTDSPASLGTEMLQFSQKNRDQFSQGTDIPNTVFSESVEVDELEFDEDSEEDDKPSLLSRIRELLSGQQRNQDQQLEDIESSLLALAETQQKIQGDLKEQSSNHTKLDDLENKLSDLSTRLDSLTDQLSRDADTHHSARPSATGTELR